MTLINRTAILIKYLLATVLVLIIIVLLIANIRIHHQSERLIRGGDTIHSEVLKELKGLKRAIQQNADVEMQNLYPEGYVFLNAIYALAWTSFLSHEEHQDYYEEGHAEIVKVCDKLFSETGRSPFSKDLPLSYGAFYNGWSSYLLGCKLRLEPVSKRNEQEIYQFEQQCDKIAEAIQQTTYPESYDGAAWPADAMVCIASLSMHDKLFQPRYSQTVAIWTQAVKKKLDTYGMIPHSVHPATGVVDENARGSSMALMLIFLSEIDSSFAQDQFALFKNNFVDSKFGLTGIREYPIGQSGTGDIDSGPVILGFGSAATIVAIQTLSLFGDDELCAKVSNGVEAFGFPIQQGDYKQYLFGTLPMADAFITWGHSARTSNQPPNQLVQFHVLSILVVLILSMLFWTTLPSRNRADV